MKKLISILISVSFISFFTFSSLFAQEQTTETKSNDDDNGKIGLNIRAFFGMGSTFRIDELDHPRNQSDVTRSQLSIPAYNASISYTIRKSYPKRPNLSLDIGLGYQYNTIKFETEKLKDDNTYEEYNYTLKAHQFSVDLIWTRHNRYVDTYSGVSLYPYIKIESVGRSDTPISAWGFFAGVKYDVCDFMNILFQGSFIESTRVSVKDEITNKDVDRSYLAVNLMLGLGFSI